MKEILGKIFEIAVDIDNLIKNESGKNIDTSKNGSGEEQVPLDVLSDELVREKLSKIIDIKVLVSEEREDIFEVNKSSKYLVAYDPLDGSSLVDVNLSIGSIFGIYENDFCGKDLIAAAYIIYGPRLEVVFADNNGVQFFRKNGNNFNKLNINPLKEKGYILAPGALQVDWLDYHKNVINSFWDNGYKLRYSGSMVPDLHQIILKGGGLFCYPEMKNKPKGKLRKLFEVFPFAFIFEKLGGGAVDNKGKRILDSQYENIHDSTACYFGSNYEIDKVKKGI